MKEADYLTIRKLIAKKEMSGREMIELQKFLGELLYVKGLEEHLLTLQNYQRINKVKEL